MAPGLAEHVPGLERLADLEMHALVVDLAAEREAELGLGLEPVGTHREAVVGEVAQHLEEVGPDEMRQHEAVVQRRAPAGRVAMQRLGPQPRDQRADHQLLGERHARVGRHLEAAELDEAEAAGGAVGRVELVDADLGAVGVAGDVDEQVAQQPVHEPGRGRFALAGRRDLGQRHLELVERVVARLVDARGLAGRADEQAREQVGHRRVPLPVQDQRAQAGRGGAGTGCRAWSRRRPRRGCRRRCRRACRRS